MDASICTFEGRQFWPFAPRVEDVSIVDIAHALSNIPRFGGHTRRFYSVAQHSLAVSHACEQRAAALGLLHDASEAYLLDIPSPIKQHLPDYQRAEERLQVVIHQAFGLDPDAIDHRIVKDEDRAALLEEQWALMPNVIWWDKKRVRPMEFGPTCVMSNEGAAAAFLRRARWLFDTRHLPYCPGLPA